MARRDRIAVEHSGAVGGACGRALRAFSIAPSTRSCWNGFTMKSFAPERIDSMTLASWPSAEHMTTLARRVGGEDAP